MNTNVRFAFAAAAVLLAAQASAFSGFVVGQARPGESIGACDAANLVFTTSADGAGIFVFREFSTSNDILYSIEGNTKTVGGTFGSDGTYDFPGANFQTPPTSNDETVWIVATFYPNGDPGTSHEGWLMYDNTSGLQEDMAPGLVPNVVQRLAQLTCVPAVREGFDPAVDPTSGIDVSFEYPVEFNTQVGNIPCELGGNQSPIEFDHRLFIGFNVYRINATVTGLTADLSTPMHYLCGEDLICGNSDDGWIGFVPLGDGTTGLSVDRPDLDPDPMDAFGVEDRGGVETHLILSDSPVFGISDPGIQTDAFTYAFQPVVRGTPTGTWNGFPSHDLDGDTIPEFVDPSGNGLGLTANGLSPTEPIIFLGSDTGLLCDGADPTPADSLALEASFDMRRGGIDLAFLTATGTDVLGFHIYRSLDGVEWTRVTRELLPASDVPGGRLDWFDPFDLRRLKGSDIAYRVEAWMADGTVETWGPFPVEIAGLGNRGRGRSR